jgi:geranylgeranyl reductase
MTEKAFYDVAVVGGGPAGATAAHDLASRGLRVALLDRAGRIKPCGGAIPPRLISEFDIPDTLLVARVTAARMISPAGARVDIPIHNGFVGMVDREAFDEWLRERAAAMGADRLSGAFVTMQRNDDGTVNVIYRPNSTDHEEKSDANELSAIRACCVIGADGALSAVARHAISAAKSMRYVFAYHEIIASPLNETAMERGAGHDFDGARCDVVYRGETSPDFYCWVFPHGPTTSVGTGSACKGFALRRAVADVRRSHGLAGQTTIRREGAPIPLKPLPRWDDGHNVVLAGDAAGVVAPASGEGIYYAMIGGRLAADAATEFVATGDARVLRSARQRFMREHGRVFWALGLLQRFWYGTDERRERFVSMCRDKDVQRLTFDAYMNKRLVRANPITYGRIFLKDLGHLLGIVRV